MLKGIKKSLKMSTYQKYGVCLDAEPPFPKVPASEAAIAAAIPIPPFASTDTSRKVEFTVVALYVPLSVSTDMGGNMEFYEEVCGFFLGEGRLIEDNCTARRFSLLRRQVEVVLNFIFAYHLESNF